MPLAHWTYALCWAPCLVGIVYAVPYAVLCYRRRRRRLLATALLGAAAAVHPLLQLVWFAPVDDRHQHGLSSRAEAAGLKGKSPNGVVAVLGEPDTVRDGNRSVIWEYRLLGPPLCWHCSHFQVFFHERRVTGWEAFD